MKVLPAPLGRRVNEECKEASGLRALPAARVPRARQVVKELLAFKDRKDQKAFLAIQTILVLLVLKVTPVMRDQRAAQVLRASKVV
jgi:hypothetical protein